MPKRVCLLAPLALLSLAACGDDAAPADGDEGGGQAGSAMNAGSSAGGGAGTSAAGGGGRGGAGGATGAGGARDTEEGFPCAGDADCLGGLRCVAIPGISLNGLPLNVCATPCSMDPDCGEGAVCHSYTDLDRDKHCVDIIEDDYASCGVAETSVCATGKVCLVDPELPVFGICATLCSAGASDEDAGVPSGAGGKGCAADQTCLGGQLAGAGADEGICGVQVDRGEECGLGVGQIDLCAPGDVCAPDDIEDPESPVRCYQDCTRADPQCDSGSCLLVSSQAGYCI